MTGARIKIAAEKYLNGRENFGVTYGDGLTNAHLGNELMDRIINDVGRVGRVEVHPKLEGRQIVMIIQPL